MVKMAGEECGIMFDFSAIQEGELDSCLKSTLKNCQGKWYSHEGYSTFGKDEEELPNLELFVQALETLQDAEEVEIRISSGYPLISVQEVDEATEDLMLVGQFVLLEGYLSKNAEEWLNGMRFAMKIVHGLVAIAQVEEDLPEENLMYAMYAASLNLPIETIAIITKKDD